MLFRSDKLGLIPEIAPRYRATYFSGSVAWFTGNKGFHDAWVVGVNGENVEIEE